MVPQREPLMEISQNDAMSSPVQASSTRRKSGRAVRAPQKFTPVIPASQSANANGKRKRRDDNADSEESQDESVTEEVDESDEEEESADEEEQREQKKRSRSNNKKPAAKKAKVNGASSPASAPALKLASRPRKPTKPKKLVIKDANATGLYAEVFTSTTPADEVASAWLKNYEGDNTGAMAQLVNLVLRSSGCEIQVTEDDINDPDNVPNRLNDFQEEERGKNAVDYPLLSKSKTSHAFRTSLTEFFASLISAMHTTGVLYDDIALIENIHLWVTTMSSSFLRPFRHTATVIALAIATSMCEVAKKQAASNAATLAQLQTEKNKRKGSNQARIKDFQQKIDKGSESRQTCESTIRDFFDTVFVHRYRDVDPRIRTDCVDALGQWMMILPDIFVDNEYLKYLGWMLSDPSGPTRHEVIRQLERIMKKKDLIGTLRHFVERFRTRIVEMAAQDAELSVRVSAIDLLDMTRDAGLLEPNDIDTIGKLIFDTEPRVRKAMSGFFCENLNDLYESKIEDLGGEEALEDAFAIDEEDPANPRPGWIKLKCLAEMLLDYDSEGGDESFSQTIDDGDPSEILNAGKLDSRFAVAAQALYEKLPELQDWEMLTEYLLFDHSAGSASATTGSISEEVRSAFRLAEKEDVILLEALYTSVKLILSPVDDHDKSKEKSKKKGSKAQIKEEQESTARRLAQLIPQLLKKFSANPATITAVLRLEHVLNLDVYQQLRQDSTAYAELLHQITTQFSGHADQRVLAEASAALLHAKGFEDLEEVTEEQLQLLWDNTLETFRGRFPKSKHIIVRGDSTVDSLVELANAVARIGKLASISNPIERFEAIPVTKTKAGEREKLTIIEMLFESVGRGLLEEADPEIDEFEDRLVSVACQASLFYFMWKVRSLRESIAAGKDIADAEIDQLKERKDNFVTALVSVLSSRADGDDARLLATGTLLDLYSLFSTLSPEKQGLVADGDHHMDGNANQYAHLSTLTQHLEPAVQEELTTIFALLEKKFARKAHKVLEAPADDDAPEDLDSDSEDEEEDLSDSERKNEALLAERQLCDLTGKLILAILAGVLDAAGPLHCKLRARLQRNRLRLGPNFREVVAYLDGPATKNTAASRKSHKSKAQQAVAAAAKGAKSAVLVEESDDEDDEADADDSGAADVEPEDADDEPPRSLSEEEEEKEEQEEEEEDPIGD